MESVDQFVETKVLPEFRDIVAMLRGLMRECAPDAREHLAYGIPAWTGRRGLAVISPTKKDITFAFSYSASFEDRFGLLRGFGTRSKHVKIRRLQDANMDALRDYIRQAVEHDAGK